METVSKVQGGKIYVKPLNYLGGLACIAVGVLAYIASDMSHGIYAKIIPAFFILFGIIMIASDLNIQVIIRNCNFLDVYMGRGLFNIFVGSQIVDTTNVTKATVNADGYQENALQEIFVTLGLVTGYAIIGLGVYLILLHCIEKNSSINGRIKSAVHAHAYDTLTQKLTA